MKRKILSLLICLCMALSMLPMTVSAEPMPVDYTLYLASDGTIHEDTLDGDLVENTGITYSDEKWSFTEVDFTTTASTAIEFQSAGTIVIVGRNSVAATSSSGDVYGIKCPGKLTTEGNGILSVTTEDTDTDGDTYNYGIYCTGLSMNSGMVNITAGNSGLGSFGIYTSSTSGGITSVYSGMLSSYSKGSTENSAAVYNGNSTDNIYCKYNASPYVSGPLIKKGTDPLNTTSETVRPQTNIYGGVCSYGSKTGYPLFLSVEYPAAAEGGQVTELTDETLDNVFGLGQYTYDSETKTIILSRNFALTNSINFAEGIECILDLNGKAFNRKGDEFMPQYTVFNIAEGATLTIRDSKTGGKITGKTDTFEDGLIFNSGNLNLESGTVSNTGSKPAVYNNGGTLTITGGSVSNTSATAIYNTADSVVYLKGTSAVKAKNYGIQNSNKDSSVVYLSGTPSITSTLTPEKANANIYGGKIYANDGETQPEYYSGETVITVKAALYPNGNGAVYGVNSDNTSKFTSNNSNYTLIPKADDATTLIYKGIDCNITWYKPDGIEALSGESYPAKMEYGKTFDAMPSYSDGTSTTTNWLYKSGEDTEYSTDPWPTDSRIVSAVSFKATMAEILTGTVTIGGEAKIGKTLTASLNDTNNTGVLTYSWHCNGEPVGTDSNSYTIAESDLGYTITVTVTSNVESGSITSAETSAVQEADKPKVNRGGGGGYSAPTYAVSKGTTETANGSVSISNAVAASGTTVNIIPKAEEGYELDTITVKDAYGNIIMTTKNEDGSLSFKMPGSKVTVDAKFKAIGKIVETPEEASQWTNPFGDVAETDWFYKGVAYVGEKGLFTGTNETAFSPKDPMTRQQMWLVLARMAGENPADMDEAQKWAMDNKISDGTNPTGELTREQFVALLWRLAGSPASSKDMSGYEDFGSVTDYAKDAFRWAVENNIVSGTSVTALSPANSATRGQIAMILYMYLNK